MSRRFPCLETMVVLSALLPLVGCSRTSSPPAVTQSTGGHHHPDDGHDHGNGHAEEGPHHGHLIELGDEEYHAELTHDDATKTVAVYLLDKEAKNPVAIEDPEIVLNLVVEGQQRQIKLAASPANGDPEGKSSRFSIVDEAVLEALEAPKATGRLNVTIGGKRYSGLVEHHEHGDHEHE